MPPDAPKYYTTEQVAEIIHRSAKTVRAAIKRGELAASRDGRGYLITDDAVRDYVADHQVITNVIDFPSPPGRRNAG